MTALVKLLLLGIIFVIETGNSDTWSNSETAIQTPRKNFFCDPKMTVFLRIKLF